MFVIELNKLNSNKVAAHAPSTIKSQLEGFEEVMKLVANSGCDDLTGGSTTSWRKIRVAEVKSDHPSHDPFYAISGIPLRHQTRRC